jgi:hypothetical protein
LRACNVILVPQYGVFRLLLPVTEKGSKRPKDQWLGRREGEGHRSAETTIKGRQQEPEDGPQRLRVRSRLA